jgi:hypothetical protein
LSGTRGKPSRYFRVFRSIPRLPRDLFLDFD